MTHCRGIFQISRLFPFVCTINNQFKRHSTRTLLYELMEDDASLIFNYKNCIIIDIIVKKKTLLF